MALVSIVDSEEDLNEIEAKSPPNGHYGNDPGAGRLRQVRFDEDLRGFSPQQQTPSSAYPFHRDAHRRVTTERKNTNENENIFEADDNFAVTSQPQDADDSSWAGVTSETSRRRQDDQGNKLTVNRLAKSNAVERVRREEDEALRRDAAALRRRVVGRWATVAVLLVAQTACVVATKLAVTKVARFVAVASAEGELEEKESGGEIIMKPMQTAAFLFLLIIVLIPYFVAFLRSVWCGWRSDRLWPSLKSVVLVRVSVKSLSTSLNSELNWSELIN